MSKTRQEKAALVFNVEQEQSSQQYDFSEKIKDLEKLKLLESRVWWDHTTLQNYLDKGIIPRGLRIKKVPTTVFSEDFTKEWNEILSACSSKLMELIVKQESAKLTELTTKLDEIDKDLTPYKTLPEYQAQIQRMESALDKQEETIIANKKSKLQRDLHDYSQDQVYEWGRRSQPPHTPRSILKKNKWRKKQGDSRVNFDLSGAENSTNEGDSSDDATQASTSTPQSSYYRNKKRNNKSKNEEKEGGGSTKNATRMQTRRNNLN